MHSHWSSLIALLPVSVSYQSLTDYPETKSVGNQSQSEYEGTATAGEVEYERVKCSVLDLEIRDAD